MKTTRFSLIVTLPLVGALPALGAQEAARDAVSLVRLERTLDPATYRDVMRVIEIARSRDLPTDPLVDRALEGAMKRAPGSSIQAAVSALAQRLEVARGALAPAPTEADIAAGAGALAVGVPRETLQAIRALQPDRPVAVPLGVLTELVARKVPVGQAASLVVELLRRGATSTQLVALGEDVQRDIAAGIEPGTAFDVRTRGVASSLPGGATATESGFAGENRDAPAVPLTGVNAGGGRNNTRPGATGTRRP